MNNRISLSSAQPHSTVQIMRLLHGNQFLPLGVDEMGAENAADAAGMHGQHSGFSTTDSKWVDQQRRSAGISLVDRPSNYPLPLTTHSLPAILSGPVNIKVIRFILCTIGAGSKNGNLRVNVLSSLFKRPKLMLILLAFSHLFHELIRDTDTKPQ